MLLAAEEEARKQNCKSIDMTVISERTELIDWLQTKWLCGGLEKKNQWSLIIPVEESQRKIYFLLLWKNF